MALDSGYWESSIHINTQHHIQEINKAVEGEIMKAVMKVSVDVDKERLLKALMDANSFYEEGYADGKRNSVVHGRWVINRKSEDGYTHHMCSKCKTNAPFHYTFIADYDEGLDGEWYYLGQRDDGIVEHMGNYCPNCGAKMDAEVRKTD